MDFKSINELAPPYLRSLFRKGHVLINNDFFIVIMKFVSLFVFLLKSNKGSNTVLLSFCRGFLKIKYNSAPVFPSNNAPWGFVPK